MVYQPTHHAVPTSTPRCADQHTMVYMHQAVAYIEESQTSMAG